MGTVGDELAIIPFLQRASAAELRASAPLWEALSLSAGEALWDEGAAVDELGVLVCGELAAELGGTVVGKVLPGELLGEASAFFAGATRTATLRAKTSAQILTLPVPSLHTLRWQRNTVYGALLDQALLTLARRIRAADVSLAQVARGGTAAPSRAEPSALVRFWKTLRPGGPTRPCPPLEPLLRTQPGMKTAAAPAVEALCAAFVAEPVTEGQVVFLEGDPGAAAWVVAEGQIDVLRHVRGDRAELLATLGPGSPFGINTLVERGSRTASCVAARPGWLWRMDAEVFGKLRGEERLVWRESVLGALATQLRGANTALAYASEAPARGPGAPNAAASAPRSGAGSGTPSGAPSGKAGGGSGTEGDRFQDLLRASGWLEGLPTGELEQMEVVITEDQRRNPRRPGGR